MIYFKSRGARYGEAWFGEPPSGEAEVDVLVHRQTAAPVPGTRAEPFLTLVTDLSEPPDVIFAEFGKNCRQKINRADNRDDLRMEFITKPATRLAQFRSFYEDFIGQKDLDALDRRWLAGAIQAGQFVLACAWKDDEELVWHGYLMTPEFAWLQYSASQYRDRGSAFRALVGRANRWLHWQCMLKFKEMGASVYDWGGMFEDESTPERAGINRFKRDFRGTEVRRFDCIVPTTARGRLRIFAHVLAKRSKALRRNGARLAPARLLPRSFRLQRSR